ncbi:bromodomain-containing protein DDB_G0280777 [Scaptodrosophila lebanonensis]|uniref:Bromodomain-containing protein DDB_G0280777 n=1 Tax=Drosophila lebanonensis TaxID=7225 RepID=A0A6J2TI59_DROLE|nr:bromodomain-containing protein DDB_G0280777 [Scaptodrosophila lebanonensis]
MKPFVILTLLLALASCEPPISKRPLIFSNWPPKSAKQLSQPGKQRTLVVQIRSDQPVPLILKGRPGSQTHAHQHQHQHQLQQHHQLQHSHQLQHQLNHGLHTQVLSHPHSHAHLHAHTHMLHAPPLQHHHLRGPRPLKLSAPVYLKPSSNVPMQQPSSVRKPLKIKLSSSKPKSKPTFGYEKPFKYEKPSAVAYSELQNLPLETNPNFISEHFAPIYTVPAPNLALHDNQLHENSGTAYLPPTQQQEHSSPTSTLRPQTYLPPTPQSSTLGSQYSVHEDETNDQTIRDPISGSQKFFAPDPDPSLPTSKIRPATESFNTPSNNKPLPADVQSNHLPAPAQPLVQIVGAQAAAQTAPEIYPIQFAQQAHLQPFIAAVPAAPIPIYNPTYLVTQSNQLYTQHKQHLFKPSTEHIIETGYVNADLTQEVASNGQILQAAKDPHHNIHPVLDTAPQFAALIAAPALGEEAVYETAPFHLPNVASAVSATPPESGFVVSNYYANPHESSQLFQAYAEEEARHQQLETQHAALELQKQQQLHLEELKAQVQIQEQQHQQQQQQLRLEELEALKAQAQEQHFLRQQQHQQQQQLQLLQLQQQQERQQQQQQQPQPQPHQLVAEDPAAAAFEEHQRLVQQQLGSNTPLRIFVPDEDPSTETRLQKRSDNFKKGTVEDALVSASSKTPDQKDSFEVTSSVEVSGDHSEKASK